MLRLIIRITPEITARRPWDMLTHTHPSRTASASSRPGPTTTRDTIRRSSIIIISIITEATRTTPSTGITEPRGKAIMRTPKEVGNFTIRTLTKHRPVITAITRTIRTGTLLRRATITITGLAAETRTSIKQPPLPASTTRHPTMQRRSSSSTIDITRRPRPPRRPLHRRETLTRLHNIQSRRPLPLRHTRRHSRAISTTNKSTKGCPSTTRKAL